MKERKSYERLIADKLQRLPAPDADASWQKMKQLLDAEDNKPVAGMKRPGNGWWGAALLALLFMSAIWTYTEYKKPSTGEMAASNNTQKQITAPAATGTSTNSLNNKNITSDNNATLNLNQATNKGNNANNLQNEDAAIGTNKSANSSNGSAPLKNEIVAGRNDDVLNNSIASPVTTIKENKSHFNTNTSINNNSAVKSNRTNINAHGKATAPSLANKESAVSNYQNIPLAKLKKNYSKEKIRQQQSKNEPVARLSTKDILTYKGKRVGFQLEDLSLLPAEYGTWNSSLAVENGIDKKKDFNNFLSKYARNLTTRALNEKEALALDKKTKKHFSLDLSNAFKPFSLKVEAEPWWAAGLAFNYTAAVSGQSRFNYNLNAKSGLLSDYIPSPFVQFHLNDYVYFQTEINLSSPQFIPRLLLYQTSGRQTGIASVMEDKTIYAQKLYYFNWPISMHYSPVNNLFLAAGIQFSSFQSGLASIQTRRYMASSPNSTISNDNAIVKFKDDSLAAKLTPTEWRWQVGADYAIKRFSVGLRYNKSFKDLLNLSLPNSHDIISARNASFIFSVRYNLFDSKDRSEAASKSNTSQ